MNQETQDTLAWFCLMACVGFGAILGASAASWYLGFALRVITHSFAAGFGS